MPCAATVEPASMKSLENWHLESRIRASCLNQVRNGNKKPSARVLTTILTSVNHDEVDVRAYFGYNSIVVGESSSGRTADSGSVSEGSNPSSPARRYSTAHSSRGLGHLPLKEEITGSNPVCATKVKITPCF